MSLSRTIEFCSAVLLAFLVLSAISFVSTRPILMQARIETKAEWDAFTRAVKQRNDLLPGLLEGLKGFEAGHSHLAERLMGSRSVALRAVDPEQIVAAVDDMDRTVEQIKKIVQTDPGLGGYPPFERPWKQALVLCRRISSARRDYNRSVKLYNRLLTPFPQNMVTALFGFVPLKEYPAPFVSDEERS